jgi:hypothetical protein
MTRPGRRGKTEGEEVLVEVFEVGFEQVRVSGKDGREWSGGDGEFIRREGGQDL